MILLLVHLGGCSPDARGYGSLTVPAPVELDVFILVIVVLNRDLLLLIAWLNSSLRNWVYLVKALWLDHDLDDAYYLLLQNFILVLTKYLQLNF